MSDPTPDDLRDLLQAPTRKGPGCRAGQALNDMNPEHAAVLLEALRSPAIPFTHVARIARDHLGVDVPHYTWNRHSKGECGCLSGEG